MNPRRWVEVPPAAPVPVVVLPPAHGIGRREFEKRFDRAAEADDAAHFRAMQAHLDDVADQRAREDDR